MTHTRGTDYTRLIGSGSAGLGSKSLTRSGRIETEVERTGKIERETRYYLRSIALYALTFARVVRADWGTENRPHWVLDVIFRDDMASS
jgi:predicted transposase YbfD/YdcC